MKSKPFDSAAPPAASPLRGTSLALLSKTATSLRCFSWRMQQRLSKRYKRLRARGIRDSKCIVAIARELCGFLWELQTKLKLPLPSQTP